MPPYTLVPHICLDIPYMFGWGIQTCGVSKHTGGMSKYTGASKHMGCVQTYKGHPNIWGCPNILAHPNMGVSKHMGCPNIQGVSRYGDLDIQEASKQKEDVQTYRGIQTYRGCPNMGRSKHTVGHPNLWRVSNHMGSVQT